MFKPTKLLKVVSILMIIFSVLGAIATVGSLMILPQMNNIPGMEISLLKEAYTPLNLILVAISTITGIVAGVAGVSGKSKKVAVIAMGIYTLVLVISTVQTWTSGMLAFSAVINFIVPLLYWWGLYQSE